MRNLKIEIEYDGTNYCGWQTQKGYPTKSIQETLEKALHRILHHKVFLIGSGRTDAGVHALAQVANFKTNSDIAIDKLQQALNGTLPVDIRIIKVKEVKAGFHSRFHVKSKLYRYSVLGRKYNSAILRNFVSFYHYHLDEKLMRQEAACLIGKHDFKAFCANASSAKNTVRTIKKIVIKKQSSGLVTIDIEADGFLYNMVRNIAGTLCLLGRHKLKSGDLKKILLSRNRRFAGPAAPAQGLCLVKVNYLKKGLTSAKNVL
ncbi:MAG: tRNA pseudouridine(38-40) synthase TruA [Candidatus Omnitrophica bacterium]|jgi:tRNA pseudouridine38-40 synthase|nr:tRNA pseudouridine(38-40) synthase TruA [Candidatus Omnitrophota bacterium]